MPSLQLLMEFYAPEAPGGSRLTPHPSHPRAYCLTGSCHNRIVHVFHYPIAINYRRSGPGRRLRAETTGAAGANPSDPGPFLNLFMQIRAADANAGK